MSKRRSNRPETAWEAPQGAPEPLPPWPEPPSRPKPRIANTFDVGDLFPGLTAENAADWAEEYRQAAADRAALEAEAAYQRRKAEGR